MTLLSMTNEYLIRKTFHNYLIITIVTVFSVTVGLLIDGIIIGRILGQSALAAFSFATPFFLLLSTVTAICANGGSIKYVSYIGKGDRERARINFSISVLICFISGIVLSFIAFFYATDMAIFFGASGLTVKYAADCIIGLSFGVLPMLFAQLFLVYIRIDNDRYLSTIGVVAMVFVNIIFVYFAAAIFGMGLFGIGLATSISYFVCFVITGVHFLDKSNQLKFCLDISSWNKDEFYEIFSAGFPTALNRGCQTLKNFSLNHLLIVIAGTTAVSALSIQTSVYQLLIAIATGYGLTVAMMCGIFFGEKDIRAIKDTITIAIRSGLIVSFIVTILLIILAEPVTMLFMNSSSVDIDLSIRGLQLFALSLPSTVFSVTLLYFYQCSKNNYYANIIALTRGFLYITLISYAFAPIFGIDIVWLSFLLGDIFAVLTICLLIRKNTGQFPRTINELLMLPESNTIPGQVLDISIKNDINQVMDLVNHISEFCEQYSTDKEKISRLAICIEEMAGNIVKFAFNDKKEHYIDIRIIIEDDMITFRMRDNGKKFNPLTDSRGEHYGLRLVQIMAKSIDYRNSIGLNNLIIVI